MSGTITIVTEEWAGSGHRMAALALQEALLERNTAGRVRLVGGLETVSPLLRKLSRATYYGCIRNFPELWQRIYAQERTFSQTLRKPVGKVLGRRVWSRLIEPEQPDIVVTTHAYCLPALIEAKRRDQRPFRLVSVCTDYHVNHFWIHPEIDYYIVAHEQIADAMQQRYGIDRQKLLPLGIPLRLPFARLHDRTKMEWKRQLGLDTSRFTVLIAGGEDGFGEIAGIVMRLLAMDNPMHLVVAAGKNERLRQQLSSQVDERDCPHQVSLLPYVPSFWEWIGAADAYITKPGGLTCAEAAAMGTPLIMYRPLPGQERFNSRFLHQEQMAAEAHHVEQIVELLNVWYSRGDEWRKAASQIRKLGRPDAVYQAADFLLGLQTGRKSPETPMHEAHGLQAY